MTEEPQQDAGEAQDAESGDAPSEEELRARLEEELRKVRVQDLLLQSVASLVNLTARRIAKEDERDLEQGRVGIEAIRALVPLLDDEPAAQVRNALSELQMIFAQASGGAAGGAERGGGEAGGRSGPASPGAPGGPAGGSAKPGGSGLWTPPGTSSS